MSAVPSADERYSFETDGFLVVESFLGCDHVARLREALQRAIARRGSWSGAARRTSRGRVWTIQAAPGSSTCWRMIRCSWSWPTTGR